MLLCEDQFGAPTCSLPSYLRMVVMLLCEDQFGAPNLFFTKLSQDGSNATL